MTSAPSFLIVRRDNIGDLLCTTPLISALRKLHPEARIDALVNSYNAPVLSGNPDLDHVYFYIKAKHRDAGETVLGVYWQRFRLLWKLRRVGYERIYLAGEGNVERQMTLVRWLKPRSITGFCAPNHSVSGLTHPVPPAQGHEVERCWALLGEQAAISQPGPMTLCPDGDLQDKAKHALQTLWIEQNDLPLVAIHISARKIPQRWPAEAFSRLMHAMHAQSSARFILFWSPGDENNVLHPGDDRKAAEIIAATQGLPVLPYPTQALEQLIAALSLCQSMICADGGAMHIGAALGLPIVCMFGNSEVERWRPWAVPQKVLQKVSRQVSDIGVEEVLAAWSDLSTASSSLPAGLTAAPD